MKNLSVILIIVSLEACSKPKPLHNYIIETDQEVLNITGTALVHNVKRTSIVATDDSIAYHKALVQYYAKLLTNDLLKGKMGRAISFTVYDAGGSNLAYKMSKKVIDSLNYEVESLPSIKKLKGTQNK